MKAIQFKAPCEIAVVDLPEPAAPAPGEALVRTHRMGICGTDIACYLGKFPFFAYPRTPGHELGLEVIAVANDVTHVKPGDRVLGNTGWGGMAEELALEAGRLVKIPDSMPFDDAAAFIMTYGTSWHALKDRANLQPGQSLLVLGAAGGVGLAAARAAAFTSSGSLSHAGSSAFVRSRAENGPAFIAPMFFAASRGRTSSANDVFCKV